MSIKCNPVDYVYQLPYLPGMSVYQMQLSKLCLSFALIGVYQLQHSKSCRSIALSVKRFCLSNATASKKCLSNATASKKCLSNAIAWKKCLSSATVSDFLSIKCNTVGLRLSIKCHNWNSGFYQMPWFDFECLSNAIQQILSIKCHTFCLSFAILEILSNATPCILSNATFPRRNLLD